MDPSSVTVRVGYRKVPACHIPVKLTSLHDAPRFQQLVQDSVKSNPQEPLILTLDGHASYLDQLLATCVNDQGKPVSLTNREVQFSASVQLPQSTDRKAVQVPWTFIMDQINLPEVWHWSAGPSKPLKIGGGIDAYRFRVGAWVCDQGAYRFDKQVPVVIVFTLADDVAQHAVQNLIFVHIFKFAALYDDRAADDAICWVFCALHKLLSDYQNIIGEISRKLSQAEIDSRHRDLPIKVRTRQLHREIDFLYALDEQLRFHMRSFRKLSRFKSSETSDSTNTDSICEVMDDALDDLGQYDTYLDSMKERFNNLIELEFNIENATQSANARFLSILGALFIPVSFAASIFGISTIKWPAKYYLYIALPLFIFSLVLVITLPSYISDSQNNASPYHSKRVQLDPGDFTLLGDDLPRGRRKEDGLDPQQKPGRQSEGGGRRRVDRSVSHQRRRQDDSKGPSHPTFYGLQGNTGLIGSRRKGFPDPPPSARDRTAAQRGGEGSYRAMVSRGSGDRRGQEAEKDAGLEGKRRKSSTVSAVLLDEDELGLKAGAKDGGTDENDLIRRDRNMDVESMGSMRRWSR